MDEYIPNKATRRRETARETARITARKSDNPRKSTLRRMVNNLTNWATRNSRKGSYNVITKAKEDEINKITKRRTTLRKKLSSSAFDMLTEPDFIRSSDSDIIEKGNARLTLRKKNTERKLKNFIIEHTTQRKINYIKSRCDNNAVCLALGIYSDYIKKNFNNFTDFKYVTDVTKIGNPSNNGFVNILTYNNGKSNKISGKNTAGKSNVVSQDFKASAILKSNLNRTSDNLLYEYLVGLYINKLTKIFPCFLETYGYYTYNDNDKTIWSDLQKRMSTITAKRLNENLTLQPISDADIIDIERRKEIFDEACGEKGKKQAILIQYFNGIISLNDYLGYSVNSSGKYREYELITILFQVYFPLAVLSRSFTHYDLHSNNVLLYAPGKNDYDYIEYHYHCEDNEIISFKSRYMVKIIDYGRCFFEASEAAGEAASEAASEAAGEASGFGSVAIFDAIKDRTKISLTVKAKTYTLNDCDYAGFNSLFNNDIKKYATSSMRNISNDLWLLQIIKEYFYVTRIYKNENFNKLLKDVTFKNHRNTYTDELASDETGKINNVYDAYVRLKELVTTDFDKKYQDIYYTYKLGDLHIYTDGTAMEYTAAVNNFDV